MSDFEEQIVGNLKHSGFVKPESASKQPPEGVKQLAGKWQAKIDLAKLSMNKGNFNTEVEKDRMYVRGEQEDDGSGRLVRANLIHAHIRKSVNQIYARNPKFAIRPTETVGQDGAKKMRLFGKTAEIVLNRVFDDSDLKRRAKACLRSAKTTGLGWAKVYYQTQLEPNPIIRNKIEDSRQQLEQLEYLKSQARDPEQIAERERIILEKKQFISQLEKEATTVVSEGLIIDIVDPMNMALDLSTVNNFDDYLQTPFLAERIVMTVEDAKKRWGKLPEGTKEFHLKVSDAQPDAKTGDHATLIHIWEIHDRVNKLIHYLPDGGTDFLQEPLEPKFVSEQWYPYIPLALNIVDGQFVPMSDVFLLRELQDEHNSARTRFAEHRDVSIPHWISRRSDVSDRDAKNLKNAVPGENVRIDGNPGQPIKNSIDIFSPPPIDPSVYMTDHTERDFERVVGGGESTQPRNNRSRTLGEANMLAQDFQAQTMADTDEVEDWFEKVAKHTLELLLQALTIEQVEAIAGVRSQPITDEQGIPTGEMSDGVVWPQMEKNEIFNLLTINIQAGSSGKPNREKETQVWIQFLLPKLTEVIQAVSAMREQKQDDLAESLIIVAQETLRRLDERFDVHEFLPKKKDKEQQQPSPEQAQQLQMQLEAQQLQMEQLRAEIEETKSKAVKNLALAEKARDDVEDDSDVSFKRFKAETDLAVKRRQLEQADRQMDVTQEGNRMAHQAQMDANELKRGSEDFKAQGDLDKTELELLKLQEARNNNMTN